MFISMIKLDMSTARQRLKSPLLLSGASTRPTMVTLKSILRWWMNDSHHVNWPSHSGDKPISNYDLVTSRSMSWVWWKKKVIKSVQYLINSLLFHFTSLRPILLETPSRPLCLQWRISILIPLTCCMFYMTNLYPVISYRSIWLI